MLQKLNSRIQGWFAWVIISLIAFTFAIFGIEHYIQSRAAHLAKAEINGQPITVKDFEMNYRRAQNAEPDSGMSSAAEQQLKQEILEGMLSKSMAIQSALSNGFQITTSQTISTIQNIPQFQQDGHFSVGRYQQVLSNALFTPEAFQTEVQEGMLIHQQRFAFSGTAFALPDELKQFVKLFYQKRDYDYLLIPYQSFAEQKKVDDAAIEAYYQQHHQDFKTPETVSIDYVRLSMPEMRQSIPISNAQIKRYYDDNRSNYNTPAKWRVAHIFLAIPPGATPEQQRRIEQKANEIDQQLQKSPEQFDALVKAESDDKMSARESGVLPWIVAGQSEFDKTLVDLTKVGTITKPFRTSKGIEIFKLINYKPTTLKSFESVQQDIKNQLLLDKVQAAYSRSLEQLSDLAYQTPDSLDPIADTLHLSIQHTAPFSREGGQDEVTKNKTVLQTAFSEELLSQGNNSEPIQLDSDSVLVFRVSKHVPSKEQPLAAVQSDIHHLLVRQQAEDAAKQFGEELKAGKYDPEQTKALMAAHHIEWKTVQNQSREHSMAPDEVNHLAFQKGKMGEMVGGAMKNGDYGLVRVMKISDGQESALTQEQLANLMHQIEESHGRVDYDLYLSGLLSRAHITRY